VPKEKEEKEREEERNGIAMQRETRMFYSEKIFEKRKLCRLIIKIDAREASI